MASLKYSANSSLQTVTLGSAYTSGSGTMSLTTGHGARLPSSGDFWLAYDNGAGTVRLFKVTARSTDTLTVTADATEGSGDGNISSGETLRWALTAAALDQLRTDICGYGTYANLPSTCKVGDQYYTSDSIYNFVATATNTWQAIYQGKAVTRPVSGDFSWVNQGSATVTSSAGNVILYAPSSASDSLRCRVKTAPSTPYTIEAGFIINPHCANFWGGGLCWRQSSDGKIVSVGTYGGTVADSISQKWTNATTYAGANYTLSPYMNPRENELWFRLTDNGTNRVVAWSMDGINWADVHTVTRTDYLTADQVGFYANSNNSRPVYFNLFHWKES